MPMDIRNFFKAKPYKPNNAAGNAESSSSTATSKVGKSRSSNTTSSDKKNPSSSSSHSSRKVAPVNDVDDKQPNKRRVVDLLDDDSDTDVDTPSPSSKKSSKSTPSSGSKRKRISAIEDEEENEISPEDFFSKSSPTKKKKKDPPVDVSKTNDLWDDDDDDIHVSQTSSTSKTSKKKGSSSRYFKDSKEGSAKKKKRDRDEEDSDADFSEEHEDDSDEDEDPAHLNESSKDEDEDFPEPMDASEDEDDDEDDDFVEKIPRTKLTTPRKSPPAKKAAAAARTPTSTKKSNSATKKSPPARKSTPRASSQANKSPTNKKKAPPLQPTLELDDFDEESCTASECLQGLTFVFTGVLENMARDTATELVKCLGGRVTTAVSSKTTYLVVGDVLEDGRPYTEGSKYKKATETHTSVILVMGEKKLYGLCQLYHDQALKENANVAATEAPLAEAKPRQNSATASKPSSVNPYAKSTTVSNPYAKKGAATVNPYARKTMAASSESVAKTADGPPGPKNNVSTSLWVDKHAPQSTRDILGNKETVQKLSSWLSSWERTFNQPKSYGKAFSNPRGPWKAALLSGPPGIGKTTTATLVAQEAGRDLLEFNASDARSKKTLQNQLGNVGDTESISSVYKRASTGKKQTTKKLKCVIMDEVDGMGAGDRSGLAELIQMIKNSKVPIICICNDRQSQKMKSLVPYCLDLKFRRPVKSALANRAIRIAQIEGLTVERNAAEAIAESCGNDVRQVLNCLQMWANKQSRTGDKLTYKGLKERENAIKKDEILRVNLFDASRTILEGRKNMSASTPRAAVDHLFKRSDCFFVDYSMVGLIVQQNYPKVMQGQLNAIKRNNATHEELNFLSRMHDAAFTMSDYAMLEHAIRGGDQNWSLLPASGMLTVKTGYHAGGETGGILPGYPEFTAWMGKNSTKGKKLRLLQELRQHLNFKISGGTPALRESYVPVFRERFLSLFQSKSDAASKEAIDLMDEYGLSREDIMEKLDEFKIDQKEKAFGDLDTKQKAAFTREYNQGNHTSQALVWEQGGGTTGGKRGKKKGKAEKNPADLDAIDEDVVEEDDTDIDDEDDLKKLQEKFKRKGRKKAPAGGGKKRATKGKAKK